VRRLHVAVPVPDGVYENLRRLKHGLGGAGAAGLDLTGDRDVEWTWVAARIPQGPGEALDFGCGQSALGLVAAHRGFRVTAVDLMDVAWPYQEEHLVFLRGDILELPLEPGRFDLVLNCSAIEHVGLAGRYGVASSRPDGDLAAMERMRALLKRDGRMLLTVPAGRDAVFAPLHRVYGPERLPRLLEGFTVETREYWLKDPENRWARAEEAAVLATVPRERLYGLACFVLRKP
jgi:SAM-dependent methyltransferase